VVVSGNGAEFILAGETNIRAGSEITVTTERPAVALRLSELDPGSWVIFQLPGFANATGGAQQASLDALRKASTTSYFKGGDSLWVKLVVDNKAGQTVTIGRPGAGVSTVGPGPGGAFPAGARVDVSR
jgi:cell migration-inducing and hyaluronan-binding protein